MTEIGNCPNPQCILWKDHEQAGRIPCEAEDGRLLWDDKES